MKTGSRCSGWLLLGVVLICFLAYGCGQKPSDTEESLMTPLPELESGANAPQTQSTTAAVEVVPAEQVPVTSAPQVPQAVSVPPATAAVASSAATVDRATAKKIQTALKQADFYTGAIDGKIGPKTKNAIMEFQRSKSLKADGKVGAKTWAALQPYYDQAVSAPKDSQ